MAGMKPALLSNFLPLLLFNINWNYDIRKKNTIHPRLNQSGMFFSFLSSVLCQGKCLSTCIDIEGILIKWSVPDHLLQQRRRTPWRWAFPPTNEVFVRESKSPWIGEKIIFIRTLAEAGKLYMPLSVQKQTTLARTIFSKHWITFSYLYLNNPTRLRVTRSNCSFVLRSCDTNMSPMVRTRVWLYPMPAIIQQSEHGCLISTLSCFCSRC